MYIANELLHLTLVTGSTVAFWTSNIQQFLLYIGPFTKEQNQVYPNELKISYIFLAETCFIWAKSDQQHANLKAGIHQAKTTTTTKMHEAS